MPLKQNTSSEKPYHTAVLIDEVLHYMAPKPGGIYVDTTFGGGSHTKALLLAEPTCTVISLDWDKNALDYNAPPLEEEFSDRFIPIHGSFVHITKLLKKMDVTQVDGILADFGTSQFQIMQLPGFSFTIASPLDMRMSPRHYKTTAYEVINRATEEKLAHIFSEYAQERASRKIARLIIEERKKKPIETTTELAQLVMKVVKPYSRTIHPATKVFQALRIFVNDELNNIQSLLAQSVPLLASGGRLVCISFHSLEDRLVKQFFKRQAENLTVLTKKVVIPTKEEVQRNPSSRSAKLRAAEKK